MTDLPKLLKARQLHSRIFAVLAVTLMLFSRPWLAHDTMLRQMMLWLGYVLVIFGAFGRIYCTAFIGGRKNHLVVREGPFSIVRNPLYVFSFLAVVGVGMESGMITLLAVLVAAFILYYPQVVAKEEAYLQQKFGEPYETYMREVPRWRPDFRLWKEPEHTDTQPRFIRRTAMDAAIFFLPLPCFVLISVLQMHQVLPVWVVLP